MVTLSMRTSPCSLAGGEQRGHAQRVRHALAQPPGGVEDPPGSAAVQRQTVPQPLSGLQLTGCQPAAVFENSLPDLDPLATGVPVDPRDDPGGAFQQEQIIYKQIR
jgi:hypothetical protein